MFHKFIKLTFSQGFCFYHFVLSFVHLLNTQFSLIPASPSRSISGPPFTVLQPGAGNKIQVATVSQTNHSPEYQVQLSCSNYFATAFVYIFKQWQKRSPVSQESFSSTRLFGDCHVTSWLGEWLSHHNQPTRWYCHRLTAVEENIWCQQEKVRLSFTKNQDHL